MPDLNIPAKVREGSGESSDPSHHRGGAVWLSSRLRSSAAIGRVTTIRGSGAAVSRRGGGVVVAVDRLGEAVIPARGGPVVVVGASGTGTPVPPAYSLVGEDLKLLVGDQVFSWPFSRSNSFRRLASFAFMPRIGCATGGRCSRRPPPSVALAEHSLGHAGLADDLVGGVALCLHLDCFLLAHCRGREEFSEGSDRLQGSGQRCSSSLRVVL